MDQAEQKQCFQKKILETWQHAYISQEIFVDAERRYVAQPLFSNIVAQRFHRCGPGFTRELCTFFLGKIGNTKFEWKFRERLIDFGMSPRRYLTYSVPRFILSPVLLYNSKWTLNPRRTSMFCLSSFALNLWYKVELKMWSSIADENGVDTWKWNHINRSIFKTHLFE